MDEGKLLRILKALAHPRRFRMIREIAAAGELSCSQLGECFTLSQPTVSHHLKILGDAGLLVVRHKAQHHFISLNRALIDEVLEFLPARLDPLGEQKPASPRRKPVKGASAK